MSYPHGNLCYLKCLKNPYSVLHIGKVNPKSNYTMGNSPLQVLKRKEVWEWLFQLVIPFVGTPHLEYAVQV